MLVRNSALMIRWGFRLGCCLLPLMAWVAPAGAVELGVPGTTQAATGPYQQIAKIEFSGQEKAERLVCFCLTPDGHIVAVVQLSKLADPKAQAGRGQGVVGALLAVFNASSTGESAADLPDSPASPVTLSTEVRILDADGKPVKSWPLEFEAQAVNVSPDGQICLGGDGQLAIYSADGKLSQTAEAPQMPELRKDPQALRAQATEELESRKNAVQEAIKSYEEALQQYAGKADKDLDKDELEQKRQFEAALRAYKGGGIQIETPRENVEEVMESILSRRKRINALAVSDKHLFITCGAPKGYGYAVWRVDRSLENPKMIVKSLSGCCGQMDIQCDGDELVVPENARHRVVRFSADGEELSSFGKRSRDGEAECFGGCCNPMNLQARGDRLFVSESDGQVKLFGPDGKFVELLGAAAVQPGCKNSSIGVAPDGKRIYYIDIENSAILVLAAKDGAETKAN